MAAGTKLVLEFFNESGNTVSFSYNYGDEEATTTSIKSAMNTMITNKAIFKNPPASIKGAKAVVTTETEFDLSD